MVLLDMRRITEDDVLHYYMYKHRYNAGGELYSQLLWRHVLWMERQVIEDTKILWA